jgi:hypothetical protein
VCACGSCQVQAVKDRWETLLLDPLNVERISSFYVETARWLQWLSTTQPAILEGGGRMLPVQLEGGSGSSSAMVTPTTPATTALSKIPQFIFKNVAKWFSWLGNK